MSTHRGFTRGGGVHTGVHTGDTHMARVHTGGTHRRYTQWVHTGDTHRGRGTYRTSNNVVKGQH